jgi:hypothetical protein
MSLSSLNAALSTSIPSRIKNQPLLAKFLHSISLQSIISILTS